MAKKNRQKKPKRRVASSVARFPIGAAVRVKPGTLHPDFPDIPLGGWAGIIQESSDRENPPSYLLEWNQGTLNQMHPVYRKRCQRDGLSVERMWLGEADLELDAGDPAKMEQPTNLVSRPLSKFNQDDRIRVILGLTSDDPLPLVTEENLTRYHRHLAGHLSFPFQGYHSSETSPFEETVFPVNVIGLLDADECDDEDGILCEAIQGDRTFEIPLAEIEATGKPRNRQLIEDYSYWFWNWERDLKTRLAEDIARRFETPGRTTILLDTMTIALAAGAFYGASLGAVLASDDAAFTAIKAGAAVLGFVGCFLGVIFGPAHGTRQGNWISGCLGMVFGALVGALLGAMVVTFVGAILGGVGGGIVGSLIQPIRKRAIVRVLCIMAGAMIGSAVQSYMENAESAWLGIWQGCIVGAIVGPFLAYAIGAVLAILEKKGAA
jgi:outer membrane lipoprotein SlyB